MIAILGRRLRLFESREKEVIVAGRHSAGPPHWVRLLKGVPYKTLTALSLGTSIVIVLIYGQAEVNLPSRQYTPGMHLEGHGGNQHEQEVTRKYLSDMEAVVPRDIVAQREFTVRWICRYGDDPVAFDIGARFYDILSGSDASWLDAINVMCPELGDDVVPERYDEHLIPAVLRG